MKHRQMISRRGFLAATGAAALGAAALRYPAAAGAEPRRAILTRPIPSTAEPLPSVGLGTWITFNTGDDALAQEQRTEVLRAFFAAGGGMIDSSPMYGSSQAVIGRSLARLGRPRGLFSADKVWTPFAAAGPGQTEESRRLWGIERFDLLQVHNLLAWEEHLETLLAMKADGRVRYVGITTSEGPGMASSSGLCGRRRSTSSSSATTCSTAGPRTDCCRWHKSGALPSLPTGPSARER